MEKLFFATTVAFFILGTGLSLVSAKKCKYMFSLGVVSLAISLGIIIYFYLNNQFLALMQFIGCDAIQAYCLAIIYPAPIMGVALAIYNSLFERNRRSTLFDFTIKLLVVFPTFFVILTFIVNEFNNRVDLLFIIISSLIYLLIIFAIMRITKKK